MPLTVACPGCQSKYSLPDELLGKKIKCKKCGKAFATKPKSKSPSAGNRSPRQAAAPSRSRPATRTASGPAASELAKLGIDGPLGRQPDIFDTAPPPGKGDPLRNHVLEDPGFGESSTTKRKVRPEQTGDDDDLSDLKRNASVPTARNKAAASREKREREDQLLGQYMKNDADNPYKAGLALKNAQEAKNEMTRWNFFWWALGVNFVARTVERMGGMAVGADSEMMWMIEILGVLVSLVGYVLIIVPRSINIGWSQKGTMMYIVPSYVASGLLIAAALLPFESDTMLIIQSVLALVGLAGLMIINYIMWAFPPDFASKPHYDTTAWVITGIYILMMIAIVALIVLVATVFQSLPDEAFQADQVIEGAGLLFQRWSF